jgi:hypothetical protein
MAPAALACVMARSMDTEEPRIVVQFSDIWLVFLELRGFLRHVFHGWQHRVTLSP